MSNNPFAQDLEAQLVAESTGAPRLPQRPADPSILEQETIDSPSSHTPTNSTPPIPQIRINEDFVQNSVIHNIPQEDDVPAEAPPAYSEVDPHPSPMASPLLSAQGQYSEENRPPTPQRPHSPSYQRPAVPPPLHLDTSYNRPPGPPPQHLSRPTSPNLPPRPVSPRLPPRPSSQYPGSTGATYDGNRPHLPHRPY